MEKLGLQLIEQPIPRENLAGLRTLSRLLTTPIMADESAYSTKDVIKLIKAGAVDVINIKIMKPGGLYRSKQVVAICEAAEIPNIIGSMLETGVGTAAGVHIAAASRNVIYQCEFVGPLFLENDLLLKPLDFSDGEVKVPDGSGLGIELDEESVERYKIEEIEVS